MTLVKTKRTITSHQRKVQGDHHRKSQKYTKTYWPYIPIIAILAGSAGISQYFISSPLIGDVDPGYAANASGVSGHILLWLIYAVIVVLLIWFSVRHYKRIKKMVLASEHVLAKHYLLDIVVALIIGALIVISH